MSNEQDALKQAMIKMSKLALIGDMAPGIAHEVNNPIAVIIGRAEILLSQIQEGQVDPAMLTKSISKINEMAQRVSKIIEAMRKVSKAAKQSEISNQSLKLIVEEVLSLCTEKVRKSLIQLEVQDIPPELNVVTNYSSLSFALMSLIFNALEELVHLPEDQRNLWITTETLDEHVLIRIKDSGRGLNSEVKYNLFSPFNTSKPQSAGLGLYISRILIQEMGATFEWDSAASQTTFVIKLTKS